MADIVPHFMLIFTDVSDECMIYDQLLICNVKSTHIITNGFACVSS
jgi:hypothetical protein